MSFETYITDKNGLQKFYEAVIAKNETYAPVEKFGKFDFRRVANLAQCNPDSPIAKTMSAKPLFFPRSAKIVKYVATSAGTEMSETDEDPLAVKRVILGMKHCGDPSHQHDLQESDLPVVFVTHMEHHSNQTSWYETDRKSTRLNSSH